MEKKLQRDEHNKMIAGVCAGLAEYLSIDITLVRVVFVLTLVLHGCGLIPYIILWIVMPKKLYTFNNAGPVDYKVPPQPFGTPHIDYSVPNPFGTVPPQQPGAPFVMPPKKASNAGVIAGIALVAFGLFFLLDNFNLLPNWEFDRLWPVIFIAAGAILVFSRKNKDPWEEENRNKTEQATEDTKQEDKTEDTPPAV